MDVCTVLHHRKAHNWSTCSQSGCSTSSSASGLLSSASSKLNSPSSSSTSDILNISSVTVPVVGREIITLKKSSILSRKKSQKIPKNLKTRTLFTPRSIGGERITLESGIIILDEGILVGKIKIKQIVRYRVLFAFLRYVIRGYYVTRIFLFGSKYDVKLNLKDKSWGYSWVIKHI